MSEEKKVDLLKTNSETKDTSKKDEKKKTPKNDDKKGISKKILDIKAEFKRIIWPTKEVLIKSTGTVIIVSLIFGVIIFGMDLIFQTSYSEIYKAIFLNTTS